MELSALLLNATSTTVLIFPMALILCICLALRDEFEDFNHHFRNAVKSNINPDSHYLTTSSAFNFEYYRRWHQDIIHLVDICDDVLSIFIFVLFVCDVPVICGFVYSLVYTDRYLFFNMMLTYVPGVGFVCIGMITIIIAGTKLNIAVSIHLFLLTF